MGEAATGVVHPARYRRHVEEQRVPAGSLAARAFAVTHHADAFRIALPPGVPHDVDAVTLRLLSGPPPWWIGSLMWLRNHAVRLAGLKVSSAYRERIAPGGKLAPGDHAGMFQVYDRSQDEILLGGDDSHLDFRASVLIERDGDDASAVLSTVVHYNSWLGRVYFFFVRPFHRLIVKAMLRRLSK